MVTAGHLARRAALFEQLATMIAAGVTLTKAMEMAGQNRSVGLPRETLQEITHHLNEGHTFTDAMQLASGQKSGADGLLKRQNRQLSLPEFDVALLSAGEESGRLDSAFRVLARECSSRANIIREIIASTIFTMLTLIVFLMVFPLSFLIAFVLGILNGQYASCLPFIIEKILVYGALAAIIWAIAFAGQGTASKAVRSFVESLVGVVPVLRTAVKSLAVSRLAMALNSLMSAGVSVIRAWEVGASVSGSLRLKREIARWTPELESGQSTPAEMVAQIRYFPDMFAQLYQSGEISGKLDDTLTHLQTYYHDDGFLKLRVFCRLVSILLYLIIAGTVGYFVIQFYVHYFNQALNAF